jgi:hypothetical protein
MTVREWKVMITKKVMTTITVTKAQKEQKDKSWAFL